MIFLTIPTYKDIFGHDRPPIEDLIGSISSSIIIRFLCFINAQLVLGNNGINMQIGIFNVITKNFSERDKNLLIKKLYPFIKINSSNLHVFGLRYTLAFIQHELENYREADNSDDTTPSQEFKILQAYFVIIEEVDKKSEGIFTVNLPLKPNDPLGFQKASWGILLEQFDFSKYIDPIYQVIKALTLLSFLRKDKIHASYFDQFIANSDSKSIKNYIFDFYLLIRISKSLNKGQIFRNFSIEPQTRLDYLLTRLRVDLKEIKENENLKYDYKGIRQRPLFFYKNSFYVINWKYVYNQISLGLIFDFHKRSGISEIKKLPDFLSLIASNVTEDLLFKKLIPLVLDKHRCPLYFDDDSEQSLPDCYYRVGKHIFIFELKDMLMSAEIIHAASYERLKSDIDSKLIKNKKGKKKGIAQLANHIEKINADGFSFDNFESKGIKRRNVVIHPIIIYTDVMYSIPGIQDYLNQEFQKMTSEIKNLQTQHISDVMMINLETFYKMAMNNIKPDFLELCETYQTRLNNIRKKLSKSPTFERIITQFPSFEEVNSEEIEKKTKKPNIERIFELLEIDLE